MEQTWKQAKAAFAAMCRAADGLASVLLPHPDGGDLGLFVRREHRPGRPSISPARSPTIRARLSRFISASSGRA